MQITWHGGFAFQLVTKSATVQTDAGAASPRADLVTLSDAQMRASLPAWAKEAQVMDWPGEYEARDVFVIGIPVRAAKAGEPAPATLFTIEAGGIAVAHLGGLTEKLTTEQIEQIGDVDVLLLPVGIGGLEPVLAKNVLEQIDPRLLIPMGDDVAAIQTFLIGLGQEPERLEVLKVEQRDLPVDAMRLVVLAPKA